MSRDFIHYTRREIRRTVASETPFYAELQSDLAGLRRPRFHVTRSLTGPAARAQAGDTIWLVGQLFTPWGKLPPSIDARIDVAALCRRSLRLAASDGVRELLHFEAAESSRWFLLADATSLLRGLHTRNAKGAITPLVRDPAKPIGQLLQSMRELDSSAPLRAWEARLYARHSDFVSYRLADGTEAAYVKVRELLSRGRMVFWDRWSLPRRLAERRERLDDAALDAHIRQQLVLARNVWAICSPRYGEEGSYSAKEFAAADRCGTLHRVRG